MNTQCIGEAKSKRKKYLELLLCFQSKKTYANLYCTGRERNEYLLEPYLHDNSILLLFSKSKISLK